MVLSLSLMLTALALPGQDLAGQGLAGQRLVEQGPVVYVWLSPECPVSNRYAPELERIERDYPAVKLIRTSSRPLARKYGVTMTPEVAVVDAQGRLFYRGRIDDQYVDYGKTRPAPTRRDLRIALDELSAGKRASLARTKAFGCALTTLELRPPSNRLRKKAGDRLLTRAAQLLRTRICNSLQSHDREGVVLQNPFSAAC
ncbi:MAG: hypothetical protein NTZ56_02050 [Acidobacteria bacterium]|nr:hypothetical protein [Acidobacteriota bacterium]